VSTPSSTSAGKPKARGLRDRPLGKVAILVAVLAAAFLVSRGCASPGDISKEEAVEIAAKQRLGFEPECHQVRFGREGVNAAGVWRVSLWSLDAKGNFERVSVVVVDSRTGRVVRVVRNATVSYTRPQCVSPV